MRKMLWIMVSIFAASFAGGANAQKIDWQIFAEPFVTSAHAQEIDWQKVDDAFGRKPAVSGDVHRYGFPRTDLTVTLDVSPSGRHLRSAAGSRSSPRTAEPWRWATLCCSRPRSIRSWQS